MQYIEMSPSEGRRFMPKIKNLIFKPLTDENFFVEPWENRELGDCAEFRLSTGRNASDEVLFFVSNSELVSFLKNTKQELYLFGAYNQINVCQMRARGTVTLEEKHPDSESIKARLRTAIESRVGSMIDKLNEEQAEERYSILNSGVLFRFQMSSYAYHQYERG
jgi:hypothetical protein